MFLGWHPTSPSFPVCHRFCALFELHFPLFPYLPPENGGQLGKAVKTSSRVAGIRVAPVLSNRTGDEAPTFFCSYLAPFTPPR